jgi:hypothetical protein
VVAPTEATYIPGPSLALNHPAQLAYFDDIFVQFYDESAAYFPGGGLFIPLLAQWGFLCLKAQAIGIKTPKVNIGFGTSSDVPPPVWNGAISNNQATLGSALTAANSMLQQSGLPGAASLQISNWCSGIGFWSGDSASLQAHNIYAGLPGTLVPGLPNSTLHLWAAASYPAPDPFWASVPYEA